MRCRNSADAGPVRGFALRRECRARLTPSLVCTRLRSPASACTTSSGAMKKPRLDEEPEPGMGMADESEPGMGVEVLDEDDVKLHVPHKTTPAERAALAASAKEIGEKYKIEGEEALLEWLNKPMSDGGISTEQLAEIIEHSNNERKVQFVRRLLKKWSESPQSWQKNTVESKGAGAMRKKFLPTREAVEAALEAKKMLETAPPSMIGTAEPVQEPVEPEVPEVPVKRSGKFTEEERAILMAEMTKYVKAHTGHEDLQWLLPKRGGKRVDADAKKGCWSEIAKCLQGRTLKSIYAFGTRIIDPGNQMGAWTQDETNKLITLVEEHGRKWAKIADEIGRSPEACHLHYRNVEGGANHKTGKWDESEVAKLYVLIKAQLTDKGFKPDECNFETLKLDTEIKQRVSIQWTKISKLLGSRNPQQCKDKFFQGMQTVAQANKYKEKDDAAFLIRLQRTGARDARSVEWNELMPEKYPGTVLKGRWEELSRNVSEIKKLSFDKQVSAMIEFYFAAAEAAI